MELRQQGNVVAGTFTTSGGTGGVVAGVVQGDQLALELRSTSPLCPGVFRLRSRAGSGGMMFLFEGVDCLGTHLGGRGRAIRR